MKNSHNINLPTPKADRRKHIELEKTLSRRLLGKKHTDPIDLGYAEAALLILDKVELLEKKLDAVLQSITGPVVLKDRRLPK